MGKGAEVQEIMAQEGEEQGTHILSLLPLPLKEKSLSVASVLNPGAHGTDVLLWITVRSTENHAFPLSVLQILFSSFVECCDEGHVEIPGHSHLIHTCVEVLKTVNKELKGFFLTFSPCLQCKCVNKFSSTIFSFVETLYLALAFYHHR